MSDEDLEQRIMEMSLKCDEREKDMSLIAEAIRLIHAEGERLRAQCLEVIKQRDKARKVAEELSYRHKIMVHSYDTGNRPTSTSLKPVSLPWKCDNDDDI